MKTRISIDKLSNHCRFIGRPDDVAAVVSEVRQLADTRLSSAIDAEVNRRLQMFMEQEGIYRIRKLRLNMTINRRDLSAHRLSAILARQFVNALEKQLSNDTGDIVYFDSEAEFIANMLADLLKGNVRDAWMYEDYAALQHLTPVDAAVQILLPRLKEVPNLVAGLQRRGALGILLEKLSEEHARALLMEWSGQEFQSQFVCVSGASLEQLNRAQEWLDIAATSAPEKNVPLALASVRHLFSCLAASTPLVDTKILLQAELHRVFLNRYSGEISARVSRALAAPGGGGSLASLKADAVPIATDMLEWIGASEERRRYVEKLLRQPAESKVRAAPATSTRVSGKSESAPAENVMFSRQAGLVLLIPVLISLRLHTCFSMATLRRGLLQTISDQPVDDCEEAWLQILLPDKQPQAVADGKLPAGWTLGLSAERQTEIAALTGHQQISQLLLAHFAARLSGLQRSSNSYLRQQFLQRSGHIVMDALQIVANLDAIPLYIVLRMSGLAGWSDRIPWLKRQLTIEIKT